MASSPAFTIGPIDSVDTEALRHSVLRPTGPIEDVRFPGDEVAGALHVGAFLDGDLVSIGTISPEDRGGDAPGGALPTREADVGSAWRVRGMATDPAVRSRGAGGLVLQRCTDHAHAHGGSVVWCNARVDAVPFYVREGWASVSEEFTLPDVGPHVVMERRLTS